MGASAGQEWRLTRQRGTTDIVGRFYQHVVAEMIGGRITERGAWEYADVYNLHLGIRVEVKARNSNNHFGIKLSQKQLYEEDPPFPIDYTLYCLASYNPKEPKDPNVRARGAERHNLLRHHRSLRHKLAALAKKTSGLYLLDLPLINAMEKKYGTGSLFIAQQEVPTLIIKRKDQLQRFRWEFEEAITELRLTPSRWRYSRNRLGLEVTYEDSDTGELHTNHMSVVLTSILRKQVHDRVIPAILQKALALV